MNNAPTARKRQWCFTWNNYPDDYQPFLDAIECRYLVAAEEVAPNTGTHHLQGFIVFASAKTRTAVARILPGCHLEAANGSALQNRNYCCKTRPDIDDVPNAVVYERGDMPISNRDKGDNERARYQNAWDLAKVGDIESIDADIRLRLYSSIKRIQSDFMAPAVNLDDVCGTWIWGESGCGKTRSVLDAYPDCYPKPRNKWWDGYQNEEVVLLDDIDKFDVALGGQLKHWGDFACFIGEKKGTSLKIRPKKIIVTSQYTIEEIWADDQTRDALNRRFNVINKIQGVDIEI